jgi:hypothetical protein
MQWKPDLAIENFGTRPWNVSNLSIACLAEYLAIKSLGFLDLPGVDGAIDCGQQICNLVLYKGFHQT